MDDLPSNRPASGGPGFKVWLVGGLSAAAVGLLLAAIYWAGSADQPELSVVKQWNEAIQRLGFEPVYPPVEDIAVGDVFAMVTEDAASNSVTGEPFAGRSIKLMHLDLTEEIEAAYRGLYQFPNTALPPERDGQIWPQSSSIDSLFKSPATRTTLPLVVFPRFTITSARQAAGSASALSRFWNGAIGAEANSSKTIEVRFSATETYGIPAVPAELRLIEFCAASATKAFCSESALRQQLSILIGKAIGDKVKDRKTGAERSRFSVELALVSRVFLARSIQTSILEDSTTRGTGRLAPEGAPPGSPAQPASAAADANGAAAEPDANTRRQNQSSMVSHVGASNSPGASMDIGRSASSNVLLPDTLLPRPVVVGFKSVRFKPPEGL
jgi:hypothetical protein